MIRWVLLLSILLWSLPQTLLALETDDVSLYVVDEPVADQSELERQLAAQRALLRVVTKATGSEVGTEHPLIQAQMVAAHKLLSDYEYLQAKDEETGSKIWQIRFRFQGEQVEDILRKAQLPRWSNRRPRVLVWLLIDTIKGQTIVYESDQVSSLLIEGFNERAVPLQLPIGDLEDSFAIAPAELWQLSKHHIVNASQRYADTVILAGRVTETSDGTWMGSWMSLFDIKATYRDVRVDQLRDFIDKGVDLVATQMASRYAVRSGTGEGELVYLQLGGIQSPQAYISMLDFWRNLSAVREVQVIQVEGKSLLLSLRIDGQLTQLQAVLDLEDRLEFIDQELNLEVQTADLFYQWKGEG